jgi:hypothetical protein
VRGVYVDVPEETASSWFDSTVLAGRQLTGIVSTKKRNGIITLLSIMHFMVSSSSCTVLANYDALHDLPSNDDQFLSSYLPGRPGTDKVHQVPAVGIRKSRFEGGHARTRETIRDPLE